MRIYINGKFYEEKKASLPALDHGLLYGDGIFETLRTYNRKVFMIDEHIARLFSSAEKISLKIPLGKREIKNAMNNSIKENFLEEAYLRITITRGTGDIGYTSRCTPNIIIIAKRFHEYPAKIYKKGVSVATYNAERFMPEVKSTSCLALAIAKSHADKKGCFDAILLDKEGNATEGTVSNIFFTKGRTLFTPRENILKGITRDIVIRLAKKDFVVKEQGIHKSQLSSFEECFLTNTSAELVPVVNIDGKPIGNGKPGKLWKILSQEFKEEVKRYYAKEN